MRICPSIVGVFVVFLSGLTDGRGADQENAAKPSPPTKPTKPHVLFIGIDDQNDWVGPLGGHSAIKTPHLDALAARGTTFLNAHCNAPVCNPSRASLMLGLRPGTTGIYGLAPSFRNVPATAKAVTLAQHFKAHGYRTLTCGKIFHGDFGPAKRGAEFDVWGPAGGVGVSPPKKLIGPTPMGNNPWMDWGTFSHRDEDKGDHKVATWAVDQLRSLKGSAEPAFLAVGFFLPHVPCYVTQPWLDLYPDDDSLLPKVLPTDRDDTPRFSWYLHWHLPEPRLKWLQQNNQWRPLVRAYLASTSFVDAQIGRLLTELKASGLEESTHVVVWSDHGWHLGEKGISGKNSLWERSTRVPLIFAGPGVAVGGKCQQPVELIDLYPTLSDICELPQPLGLEGQSLRPQLTDPETTREHPAITTSNQNNHAIRTQRHRFIQYADGSQELYDHSTDPHEWHNLASRPDSTDLIAQLKKWLPTTNLPPAPHSASRVLTYDAAKDEATWEGTVVRRTDPVPE